MPWDANSFRSRHNHGLTAGQAAHAASIANAILRRGAPEGIAIATANKRVERGFGGLIPRYDDGGSVPGLGAPQPSVATASPQMQTMIQRFAALSPEQLQEAVMRMGASPLGQIASRVLQQKRMMPSIAAPQAPQQPPAPPIPQAPAQPDYSAQSEMRKGGTVPHLAPGGFPMGMASPWWERAEERGANDTPSGLLHSPIAGRTDHIPLSPAADSYVIPADVVSGLGEGNTLAGARALDAALNTAPYGGRLPQARGARSQFSHMPSPPRSMEPPSAMESKGGATKSVPILAAGGEYVVHPTVVARLGGGDVKQGHKVLDAFVKHARAKVIKTMQKLPGPVK